MKHRRVERGRRNGLGRRGFLQGASLAFASLALPRSLRAQGIVGATPQPYPGLARHTFVFVNLRGAPDGLALLAPAQDPHYVSQRMAGTNGTLIDANASFNTRLGFGSRWWLPHALTPLAPIFFARDLALVPAAGLVNYDKSHFVAMDRFEFGIPPASQGYNAAITSGFVARMLANGGFPSVPPLRGLVASNLATTGFLEAPKSLAIGNVEEFGFPETGGQVDQLLADATDMMHDASPVAVLQDASQTAFDTITYLDQVDFNHPGLSAIGSGAGQYPNHPFGIQFRRAAALLLNGDPPEAIEIDLGSWDHHNQEGPNPDASLMSGGTMWTMMDRLARALSAFYDDLSGQSYPHGTGTWMDHATVYCQGEFGRRVAENGSQGTDHGKGGVLLVMGGSQVNGGVYDAHWTQLGDPSMLGMTDMTDAEGDVKVAVDHRNVLSEAFVKLMNLNAPTDVYFPGYSYQPLGIFN